MPEPGTRAPSAGAEVRAVERPDLDAVRRIYNEGIEDRIATLETTLRDEAAMAAWLDARGPRHPVLVAVAEGDVVGWASINPYNQRCAYAGVGELSVYVARSHRGQGVGGRLLSALEAAARELAYHKLVLFTFPWNALGQGLYRKRGYREVGVFEAQGILDGRFVDVMAMEKRLLAAEAP